MPAFKGTKPAVVPKTNAYTNPRPNTGRVQTNTQANTPRESKFSTLASLSVSKATVTNNPELAERAKELLDELNSLGVMLSGKVYLGKGQEGSTFVLKHGDGIMVSFKLHEKTPSYVSANVLFPKDQA